MTREDAHREALLRQHARVTVVWEHDVEDMAARDVLHNPHLWVGES